MRNVFIFLGLVIGWAAGAQADETVCAPGQVLEGEYDDVRVLAGDPNEPYDDCVLSGATVHGDVLVEHRGELLVTAAGEYGEPLQPSTIEGSIHVEEEGTLTLSLLTVLKGNLHSYHAEFVRIFESTIEGNWTMYDGISVSGCQGATILGNVELRKNRERVTMLVCNVGGNVWVSNNTGGIWIVENPIAGNVKIFKNSAEDSQYPLLLVDQNEFGGNLSCWNNDPALFTVTDNYVYGEADRQCEQY